MLNKCFLLGRMTKDPEIRRTNGGTAVTSFTLAVDRDFKTNGEKETDFIEVVAWRNTAEFVSKYFSKGRMAIVEGRLQIREWTDKSGNKRRTAEVVADNVYRFEVTRWPETMLRSHGNTKGRCLHSTMQSSVGCAGLCWNTASQGRR